MPDCRYCGHEEAYDTGFTVECPNIDCEHYSREQLKLYMRKKHSTKWAETNKILEEYLTESSDPDITPVYHWGIDSTIISKGED